MLDLTLIETDALVAEVLRRADAGVIAFVKDGVARDKAGRLTGGGIYFRQWAGEHLRCVGLAADLQWLLLNTHNLRLASSDENGVQQEEWLDEDE